MPGESVIRSFAVIVDGDVVITMHVPPTAKNYDRVTAGLSSNPIIVESTSVPGVDFGWTYDGENFIAPQVSNG